MTKINYTEYNILSFSGIEITQRLKQQLEDVSELASFEGGDCMARKKIIACVLVICSSLRAATKVCQWEFWKPSHMQFHAS